MREKLGETMKRLCTICVRSGSKGVPGKNARLLLGKPLLAHSIGHAKAADIFAAVAVSSDSPEILRIAGRWGADVLVERPVEMAGDAAPKLPAIQHCARQAELRLGTAFDVFVDLDATSPLRIPEDIRNAVDLLETRGVSNVISGAPARRSPYFNLVEADERGFVHLSKPPQQPIMRRQDSPRCFDLNASIYVWRRDALLEGASVLNEDTLLYEMPAERSVDIDCELDFSIVEMLMRRRDGTEKAADAGLFSLRGKTAVVTGGLGILGRGFCEGLAEFGADVAVVDLDENAARDFANEVARRHGVKACGVGCDVSSPDAVRNMVAAVTKALGDIHVLHNNAASKSEDLDALFASVEDYSLEQWRKIMAVNLDGMFLVAQAVGSRMAAQGRGGSIIQTASIYGAMAPDQRIYDGSFYMGRSINTPAVYTTSKAGVIGLTKHLASYWANRGIRVNCLVPGGAESGQNETFKRKYSERIPLGRMAQPRELVGALIYLASDASSYVTGQNIVVDGGLSVW